MATQPTPAPATSSALVPVATSSVEVSLDDFPVERFNRVVATQTIRMPSDLLAPAFQVVQAELPGADGKSPDIWRDRDIPAGHWALSARMMRKLAGAASVSFYDERRIDDGHDPDILAVGIMATMTLPTGQRISAPGSMQINIREWFSTGSSAAEIAKFRKRFWGHVATRAMKRALQHLLSLKSSYTEAELLKPFVVATYVPNLNHPEIRKAFVAAMVPTIAQLYGPSAAAQLPAGDIVLDDTDPDEEPAAAPEPAFVAATGTSSPDTDAGPEPSWFGTVDAPAAAAAPVAQPNPLLAVLRAEAASSGMVGPATAPQLQKLAEIFVARGIGRPATDAGLRIVFGITGRADFTGAQAQALIEASVDDTFGDLWRELVAGDGAQAG
jgi:hypothetical protein